MQEIPQLDGKGSPGLLPPQQMARRNEGASWEKTSDSWCRSEKAKKRMVIVRSLGSR